MTWLRKAARMLASALRPWPARADRQAAITAARGEKERSQRSAAHAEDIARDIRWLYEQNHWIASVADAMGIDKKGNGDK